MLKYIPFYKLGQLQAGVDDRTFFRSRRKRFRHTRDKSTISKYIDVNRHGGLSEDEMVQ